MERKIVGMAICMLMIVAAIVPAAMTRENSSSQQMDAATAVPETENGCGCFGESVVAWEQLPDINETGIDICVDRIEGNITRMIADDFRCNSTGPLTDIHLWGSWLNDIKGNITKIHLSIHSDIPVGPGQNYSIPGQELWQKDFYPGQFTEWLYYQGSNYPEWWWDPWTGLLLPHNHVNIWEYDITVPDNQTFKQNGTTQKPVVYWLDVYVEVQGGRFGWKTSWQHWNDDAVLYNSQQPPHWFELRYPEPHPNYGKSIDMAFRITKPKCCFIQTWPTLKRKLFIGTFQIPVLNICNQSFPSGSVRVTWTFTNTGPSNMICFPASPWLVPTTVTATRTFMLTYSGSWVSGGTEPVKTPILIGLPRNSFIVTLQIDDCPPEVHHGGMLFLFFGWYQ